MATVFGIPYYPITDIKEETSMKEYVEHINRKKGKKGKKGKGK